MARHRGRRVLTRNFGGNRERPELADGCVWELAPQSSPSPIYPIFSIVCFGRTLGTAAPGHKPTVDKLS